MLWLLIEIAIYIATTVLSMYLASKAIHATASALGDFSAPTAEEGRVIPVVFGTVKLAAPNVVWYGDLKVVPIKKGFIFKSVVGFKYFIGMDLMLCHGPIDSLSLFHTVSGLTSKCVGDGSINIPASNPGSDVFVITCEADNAGTFTVTSQSTTDPDPVFLGSAIVGTPFVNPLVSLLITEGPTVPFAEGDRFQFTLAAPTAIFAQDKAVSVVDTPVGTTEKLFLNSPKLFGGEQQQGGIVGPATFYRGTPDQPPSDYLSAHMPGANPAPAYAGYCHLVMEQDYIGTQNTVPYIAVVVRRCPDPLGLGPGYASINGDANPACIVWDLMTNYIYGIGIPEARFDREAFAAAAHTLALENLGMSIQLDNAANADSTIAEVLQHISGVLYTDPATALWTLKLVRDDYDPDDLVEIGDGDVLEPPEFSRLTWDETLNEIKIKYCDRSLYFTPRIAQAQETANMATRSQLASDSQDFLGLSNFTIAQFVAARELRAHSYPLGRVRVRTNRKAWNFRVGGVFAFSSTRLGLTRVPFRIANVNYGELTKGEMEVNAVEDVFGTSYTTYTPPQSSGGWGDPNPPGPPPPPIAEELMEAPYLVNGSTARFVLMLVARGDGLSLACDIQSSTSGPLALTNEDAPFIPVGYLRDAYPQKTPPEDSAGFVLASGVDLDTLAPGPLNLFLVDDEVMSFGGVVDLGDGSFALHDIARGLLDTLPGEHAPGATAWFFGEGAAYVQPGQYAADVTVTAKALPSNAFGSTAASRVPSVSLTTASRAKRPYPPGGVLVNGVWYPVAVSGDAAVAWFDRHRVNQAQNIVRQDAPSWPGGVEGNYTIRVSIAGVVIENLLAQVGNAFAFTVAERLAVAATGPVVFEITAVNGALVSETRTLTFWMTGFGMGFGLYFGGIDA